IYFLILLPGIAFIIAASLLLNSLLRDRYLTYGVSVGIGLTAFYFFSQGYNHWSYNPVLYQLWTYDDLSESKLKLILAYRIYWLAITIICLLLAQKTTKTQRTQRS